MVATILCAMFSIDASVAIATSCRHASIRSSCVPYLAVEPTPVISTGDDYGDPTGAGEDGHDGHEDHDVSECVFSVAKST